MSAINDKIREQAAEWFSRRRDGVFSQSERVAFQRWCDRGEAHRRAYAEVEHSWQDWEKLRSSARMREMSAAAMKTTASEPRKTPPARQWYPLLTAAALLVAVCVPIAIRLLPVWQSGQGNLYISGFGEQHIELLPDGTRITLNTETEVQMRYQRRQREAVLKYGEAMFEVAHDARRPFVVVSGEGSIVVLGTRFDVRRERGVTVVTLVEGQLRIDAQGESRRLAPGEQARYGTGVSGVKVSSVDVAGVTAWLHGRLDFEGMPLSEALREANRYSTVKIRLGDPALADMMVGGSFRVGDNFTLATALATIFPVRIASSDEHEIVLMSR